MSYCVMCGDVHEGKCATPPQAPPPLLPEWCKAAALAIAQDIQIKSGECVIADALEIWANLIWLADQNRRAPEPPAPAVYNLVAHLERQRAWSSKTFGPGVRTEGVLDHIRKELQEIERAPLDLIEWIDVVLLSLDGAWRAGHTPAEIANALELKQGRNEQRKWPDWRQNPNGAIEHIKEPASAPAPSSGGISSKAWLTQEGDETYWSVKLADAEALEHEVLRWQATAKQELRDTEEREQELERQLSQFQQANDKAAKEWHRMNEQLAALRAEKEAADSKWYKLLQDYETVCTSLATARQEQHRLEAERHEARGIAEQYERLAQQQIERYDRLVAGLRALAQDWEATPIHLSKVTCARELWALLPTPPPPPATATGEGEKGK